VSFTLQHALALLVKAQPTRTPFRSTLLGSNRAARCAIAGSRGELWVRPAADPKRAAPHLHLHLTELAGVPVLPAAPHRTGTAGRGGHRAWPPAPPLAGLLPTPSNPQNRPLGTQGPFPARARPAPAGGWPEFGRTAAARPPGTTLQRGSSSRGLDCKTATEIVFGFLLILVNCIENHRKIRKMQTQFYWIRCELCYNFCYSGLS
jgi:hypothetical protein